MTKGKSNSESSEAILGEQNRRTIMKTLAAAGIAGAGATTFSGSAAAQKGAEELSLNDVPITDADGEQVGTFNGTLELNETEPAGGSTINILEGKLEGTVDGEEIDQELENIDLDVLGVSSGDGECPVLNLELGPLELDLLGLEVFLSEIQLDVTAVAGEGNLLGNLLCAVAGLLD